MRIAAGNRTKAPRHGFVKATLLGFVVGSGVPCKKILCKPVKKLSDSLPLGTCSPFEGPLPFRC